MGAASDIIIFHAVPTRSCRIVWLLEELGVPYTLRAVDFPAGLTMPEYLAINPMGTLPYFIAGDVEIGESVAVMYYLLDKYGNGRLQPPQDDTLKKARFYEAMSFIESQLGAHELPFAMHHIYLPEEQRVPEVSKYMMAAALKALTVLEARFFSDERTFLTGDEFTAADIVAGQCLTVARLLGFLSEKAHPRTSAYLDRLTKRPTYVKIFGPQE